jgi:hypothetical protein
MRRKDYIVAARRINRHGLDLPAVREIVKIGGVETIVEIPVLMIPTRAVSQEVGPSSE